MSSGGGLRGASLGAVVALVGCSGEPVPPPTRPDVLLVVLDTVRADVLSTYGHDRVTDAQLAQVAAAGVVFEDVTAPGSWTWPSHASLFTGVGPWVHGARTRSVAPPDADPRARFTRVSAMRSDLPTLAERMVAGGYRAEAITQNTWLHPDLGLTRGFEKTTVVEPCPQLVAEVERVLAAPDDRPSFLFLNILLAHAPYYLAPVPWLKGRAPDLQAGTAPDWTAPFLTTEPSPGLDLYRTTPGLDKSGFQAVMSGALTLPPGGMPLIRDLYEGGVAAADYCFLKALQPWLAKHPGGVVVVTSDHGEYLGEHGLLEHGQTAWGPVLNVPLVVAAPGRLPAGTRVQTPVQLQDVPGTILELVGLPPIGRSLLPVVSGAPREGAIMAAAWHHPEPAAEIGGPFTSDWWLYRSGEEVVVYNSDGAVHLYDHATDPLLEVDLAGAQPERAGTLAAEGRAAFPVTEAAAGIVVPDDVAERLRVLGYHE